MLRQCVEYGKLASAHVKILKHKLWVGSEPATRVPAVEVDRPSSWLGNILQKMGTSVSAYTGEPALVFQATTFPSIFLGSAKNAANGAVYKKHNIDCVLNCAAKVPSFYEERITFYQHLPMVDDASGRVDFVHDETFRRTLYKFVQTLYTDTQTRIAAGEPPRNLLIHCVYGRSRSVAITILLIFLWNHFAGAGPNTMATIYRELYTFRPVIEINVEFYKPLMEFEKEFNTNETFRKAWLTVFTVPPSQ